MLLLRTLNSSKITPAILNIELDINLAPQVRLAAIQSASLDAGVIRHHLQLGVQTRAAGWAEEMLVDFARVTDDIVGGGGSWRRTNDGIRGDIRVGQEEDRRGGWVEKCIPLVTLKLVRGTTALEVKAPPAHYNYS